MVAGRRCWGDLRNEVIPDGVDIALVMFRSHGSCSCFFERNRRPPDDTCIAFREGRSYLDTSLSRAASAI